MGYRFQKKKRNKYNNIAVNICGEKFVSKKEGQRWLYLSDMQKKGIILDLKRQVKFELIPAIRETYIEHLKTKDKQAERTLQLAINYICDFEYVRNGERVIEDVKASEKLLPKEFTLKEKLFFWKYGVRIKKVYKWDEPID